MPSESRTLLLMRHAHAEPSVNGDRARRLTADGEVEARRIGGLLSGTHDVDSAVASAAVRAVQTARAVLTASGSAAEVHESEPIYKATADDLLAGVHGIDPASSCALLVAHQPVIQEFALDIADEDSDPGYVAGISAHFKPATLAVFKFDGLWPELEYGEAELIDVLTA